MTIYGTTKRFILGTYTNQSQRCTFAKEGDPVQYDTKDQYESPIIRKLGNRYTTYHRLYDFTADEKTALLAMNATIQSYVMCYDSDYTKDVYCDIYYDDISEYPKSFIDIKLTDVLVDTNPDILYTVRSSGWYAFNGTSDSILTPLTSIMAQDNDTFIYECDFNLGSTTGEIIFFGNTNGAKFHLNATTTTYYQNAFGWDGMYRYYYTNPSTFTRDDQWHHLEATLVLGASGGARPLKSMVVKVDGVTIAGFNNIVGGVVTNGYDWSIGKAGTTYTKSLLLKNIEVTTVQSGVSDGFIYTYDPLNPNKSVIYDTSVYDNNGTPVVSDPDTFFIPPASYPLWYVHPNIKESLVLPKFTYLTNTYTFASTGGKPVICEYEIENAIDFNMTSQTGKLHRRYITDENGDIKQLRTATIVKHNLTRADYEALRIYDRQLITFYPHQSDTATYYSAYCSILFLHEDDMMNFDYCEITLDIK